MISRISEQQIARILCVAAGALALVSQAGAQLKHFSMPGTSISISVDFGSLRLDHGRVTPCRRSDRDDWTPPNNQLAPPPPPPQPDLRAQEVQRAKNIFNQGMNAFMASHWVEAIRYLEQALSILPEDPAIKRTLTSAKAGLNCEELQRLAVERAEQRVAEDTAHTLHGVDLLNDSLDTMRQQASQNLIDRGQFEAAVNLPAYTDFVYDSSVVDLREARQGVVNFEVLKPPASRTGNVEFSQPVARHVSPETQKARRLLDNPALESVIFFERMGDALAYTPSAEERAGRFADPVTKAVADSLSIDLGSASAEELARVRQKTQEIWDVYDSLNAQRGEQNAGIYQQSVKSFRDLLGRLTAKGVIKPGENLLAREKADPGFRDMMKAEVKAIVLEEEISRREADRSSFDKLLGGVGAVLEGKPRR